uniref:Uncharacterized protein n=1 Tax=Anguilla anguilla TaxID=7936 RepID=A0A0E9QVZ9_ANGAN
MTPSTRPKQHEVAQKQKGECPTVAQLKF